MSNQQTPTKRTFGQRLWWIIRAFLVWLFLMAIIVGIAVAGFVIFEELQRSFTNVNIRMDAIEQNATLLRTDVTELMDGSPAQAAEIMALNTEINRLRTTVAALEEQLAADLVTQGDRLAALDAQLTALTGESESLAADAATLSEAFVALQSDLNTNSMQIDTLGGDLDALRSDLDNVNTGVTELQTTAQLMAAEGLTPAQLRETMALFHIWEMISRARLRIAQNNIGLATEDVVAAIGRLDIIMANASEENDALAQLEARLNLALASLPDAPLTAVTDLNNAWNQLDAILLARLLPAAAALEAETTAPEALQEAQPPAETPPATAPAATPAATPALTPTPAPTATP